jgi:hypothetical protein
MLAQMWRAQCNRSGRPPSFCALRRTRRQVRSKLSGSRARRSVARQGRARWPRSALARSSASSCVSLRMPGTRGCSDAQGPRFPIASPAALPDGARWIEDAISRSDWPSARPREISSRSHSLRAQRERRRGGGSMPPLTERTLWIEPRCFASARAMSFRGLPAPPSLPQIPLLRSRESPPSRFCHLQHLLF